MFIPYGRLQKAFFNQKCTEKIIKDKLGEAGDNLEEAGSQMKKLAQGRVLAPRKNPLGRF